MVEQKSWDFCCTSLNQRKQKVSSFQHNAFATCWCTLLRWKMPYCILCFWRKLLFSMFENWKVSQNILICSFCFVLYANVTLDKADRKFILVLSDINEINGICRKWAQYSVKSFQSCYVRAPILDGCFW